MANILGEQIQLFLSGKTLACATSCSVNISSDDIDVSCKDSAGFNSTIPSVLLGQLQVIICLYLMSLINL